MTASSTTDLIGAVTGAVTAALALLAAGFAVWWWLTRLRVVALVDRRNRIHVWLANRGREARQVVGVAVYAVRSRMGRLQVQSQGGDGFDVVIVQRLLLEQPFDLAPGQGQLVVLQLAANEIPLPRPNTKGLERRRPAIEELRVAIDYGDGARSLRRLRRVDGFLGAGPQRP